MLLIGITSPTEVLPISFVYFTSRGCYASMGSVGELGSHHTHFATSIPNFLHCPMLAQHSLLVKHTKLMGRTPVSSLSLAQYR